MSRPEIDTAASAAPPAVGGAAARARRPAVGRNEPCPCGSGRKYKKCCAAQDAQAPRPAAAPAAVPPVQLKHLLELLQQRRFADVEHEARRLLVDSPQDGLLWKLLAQALWGQGHDPLPALEQAASLLPADAEAHSNLGNLLRARGQLDRALACQQHALKIDPRYAQGHNNLGSVLCDLGRTAEAESAFRQAIALNRGLVPAHANLGNTLLGLGRPADAVRSYEHALKLQPDLAEVRRQLGRALRNLGRLADAATHLRRVATERPDDLVTQKLLGATLLELGQTAEAEAAYRRAIAIAPDDAATYADLAAILVQHNRAAEAQEACDEALRLDPRCKAALLQSADLQAARGQFADAESSFRRALEVDPDMPEALAGIVRCRRVGAPEPEWLAQAQRVAQLPLPARRKARLHYALGKYHDDLGEYAQAFEEYRRANELAKSYSVAYDRRQHSRYVDALTQHYDRRWLEAARCPAAGSGRAVFIVGMWRSGTTLAEQVLASHPSVFGSGESPFWKEAAMRLEAQAPVPAARRDTLGELGGRYLESLAAAPPSAARVVDKMASNFLHLGLIHAALPEARFIHLRRHPVATCLSIYFQDLQGHAYANDLADLAHFYTEYLRVMQHWREVLPPATLLEVDYEDLVEKQEATSRALTGFLGLEWDPRCLDFHRLERTVLTRSKWQVRQPLSAAASGHWRRYEPWIGPLLGLAASEPAA